MTTCLPYRCGSSARVRGLTIMLACCALVAGFPAASFGQATSSWVYYDSHGKLRYGTDAAGNRIIDYSWAGYRGGGVALPRVPARVTVNPSGGDDTAAIQSAIDTVSALQPDRRGFRGAVLLSPGSFNVSATLHITTSGVVLAGSGSGTNGSILTMTGSPFALLAVSGSGSYTRGTSVSITDNFVPSGARSFSVSDASGFNVGDRILISRPVTAAWVSFMGMDKLVRNGLPQTWIAPGSEILTDRTITAINGSQIFIDAPVTDSFDSQFLSPPGGSIATYTFAGRISQVGIEHLRIVAPATTVTSPLYQAATLSSVQNGWLRDLNIQDTENTFQLSNTNKQITLDSISVVHTVAQTNSAAPADFALSGTQILVNNCSVTGHGNTWPFVTQAQVTGPVVVLEAFADDRGFAPHQRWATGLLCDLCRFPSSFAGDKTGIAYSNRGNFGSGQGWDAGWSVAWNVATTDFLIQAPPGTHNWCIGCTGTVLSEAAPGSDGTILPNGIYESLGTPVTPGSLYLAQLKQRLGTRALRNIGYADTER
ncbi:MAG: hypothetical protein JWO04_3784 [Gammaproteobacteria bacterium]|nr:hypothetical protein [Gammaproteobacteria bacterium]